MRSALCCALLASLAHAGDITIVLDFKGPRSERSIAEMKREFAGILKDSGVSFDWRTRDEAAGNSYTNLVLVKFKGKCVLEPVGYLYDERGPLAFTYANGGAIQPFSEVECDKVTAELRSAMFGGDFAQADLLLGRALGRVVAHEMIHILSNSKGHAREGVAKEALSGKDLISANRANK